MLHILCHQGNANYNHSEVPLHTYQNARGPELSMREADEDARWQNSHCGNAKWYSHSAREFSFLQNEIESYQIIQSYALVFTQMRCKFMSTQKCTQEVYSSIIYKCKILKATKIFFSRWMDKLWHIQTTEYYLVKTNGKLTKKEISYQAIKKVWRNFQCMLLSESS